MYNGQSCEKKNNKIVTIKLNGIGGKQDKEKRELQKWSLYIRNMCSTTFNKLLDRMNRKWSNYFVFVFLLNVCCFEYWKFNLTTMLLFVCNTSIMEILKNYTVKRVLFAVCTRKYFFFLHFVVSRCIALILGPVWQDTSDSELILWYERRAQDSFLILQWACSILAIQYFSKKFPPHRSKLNGFDYNENAFRS